MLFLQYFAKQKMFKNTDKKIWKGMLYLATVIAAFLFVFNNDVFAVKSKIGGVTVITDGWRDASTGLGENKVFVDTTKITTNSSTAVFSTTGNLTTVDAKKYTYAEMQNGTYENERSSKATFEISSRSGKYIVISKNAVNGMTGASSIGKKNNIGTATIKWPEAAKDQDNNKYDVEMTIDNVTYYSSGRRYHEFAIFGYNWHYSLAALQEHPLSELTDEGTYYHNSAINGYYDGIEYDVTIKLYKTGTSTLIDADKSAMAMSFEDLDVTDSTYYAVNNGGISYWLNGTAPNGAYPQATDCTTSTPWQSCTITLNPNRDGNIGSRYLAQGSTPNDYAESITILSGLKDNKIYTYNPDDRSTTSTTDEDGTYLYFSKMSNDQLRISGTRYTGDDNQPSQDTSRFLALVDARGFKYHWSGSNCGTKLGFIGTKKVETAKGTNGSHLTITSTDNDVLWREDKTITIEVDEGYYINKVTIDNVNSSASSGAPSVLTYVSRSSGKRKYTYTFSEVVDDHSITVNAQPIPYTICKKNSSGTLLTGAKLQLTGVNGSTAINFSQDSNIASAITNTSSSNTMLEWTSTNQCATIYALPSGTYTLKETIPPTNYAITSNITFTVSGSGSNDNTIASANPSSAKTGTREITMTDTLASDGGVQITKILRGAGADANKEFTIYFEITGNGNNSALSSISYSKTSGGTTTSGTLTLSNNKANFKLKGGDTITLTLRSGYQYKVTEASYTSDGYTTTFVGQTGTVSGNGYETVQVINTKDGIPVSGVDFDVGAVLFISTGMMIAGAGAYITWRARRLKT